MKKIIYLLLFTSLLLSCNQRKKREDKAIIWIYQAEKPVFVYSHTMNAFTCETDYTLISSDGKIYRTGNIPLALPDTIKQNNTLHP